MKTLINCKENSKSGSSKSMNFIVSITAEANLLQNPGFDKPKMDLDIDLKKIELDLKHN